MINIGINVASRSGAPQGRKELSEKTGHLWTNINGVNVGLERVKLYNHKREEFVAHTFGNSAWSFREMETPETIGGFSCEIGNQ